MTDMRLRKNFGKKIDEGLTTLSAKFTYTNTTSLMRFITKLIKILAVWASKVPADTFVTCYLEWECIFEMNEILVLLIY